MSLDSLCRWQVQIAVYFAWRIPAHLRCTQCSNMLHFMDICFQTYICLWQISQIQTRLFNVVGPGLISTSLAFVSSSASHPLLEAGRFDTICTAVFVCSDSSTACILCRLEPGVFAILLLSIFCIMLSNNLIIANSVECPDLKPYCCSHNKLFVLK